MSELQKELRRPGLQQSVFSYAKASPTELVRSKLSTTEIQHRALTYLPDEILANIPENDNEYSLFQGFQALLPGLDGESEHRKKHRRHNKRGQQLLESAEESVDSTPLAVTKKERLDLNHRLEMMGVRKNMCSAEIREIDNKIANLTRMRKIVLDRLENLEQEEVQMEQELLEVDTKLEDLLEEMDDAVTLGQTVTPPPEMEAETETTEVESSFMSASIYEKLPSPKTKRHKPSRRKSTAMRHEHFEPGLSIMELQAHNDMITALDFDAPFGTMVSSALDDTVRVWDLNLGRCIGLLEGHQASVRCLQVEDNIVATGSMDASIRLWDLSEAEYVPREGRPSKSSKPEGDAEDEEAAPSFSDDHPADPPPHSSTAGCHLHTLSAHVAEVTALHFKGDTLVSGSADKTLRQWDLVKGRCVQTLDVLWAAAQASASINTNTSLPSSKTNNPTTASQWANTGPRIPDASADFVGALQCFDAALACGTADGMVRLWDLRSGQVHRSLVGHTGAVTCLQFDERVLVTGSADRSIRVCISPSIPFSTLFYCCSFFPPCCASSTTQLPHNPKTKQISANTIFQQIWDLRTGTIHDAYAYDSPVSSMMFDPRRIVAAAGENVAKVYDKAEGRHWDCGAGVGQDGTPSVVERVRVRDGYMVEGRKDGMVGVWSC